MNYKIELESIGKPQDIIQALLSVVIDIKRSSKDRGKLPQSALGDFKKMNVAYKLIKHSRY